MIKTGTFFFSAGGAVAVIVVDGVVAFVLTVKYHFRNLARFSRFATNPLLCS